MNKLLLVVLIIGLVALPAEGNLFKCKRQATRAIARGDDPCDVVAMVEKCVGFSGPFVDTILAGMGIVC